jgi:hypothetical protein
MHLTFNPICLNLNLSLSLHQVLTGVRSDE